MHDIYKKGSASFCLQLTAAPVDSTYAAILWPESETETWTYWKFVACCLVPAAVWNSNVDVCLLAASKVLVRTRLFLGSKRYSACACTKIYAAAHEQQTKKSIQNLWPRASKFKTQPNKGKRQAIITYIGHWHWHSCTDLRWKWVLILSGRGWCLMTSYPKLKQCRP